MPDLLRRRRGTRVAKAGRREIWVSPATKGGWRAEMRSHNKKGQLVSGETIWLKTKAEANVEARRMKSRFLK